MKITRFLVLASALLGGHAFAEDATLTIPANRVSSFGRLTAMTADCRFIGKPQMGVPKKPAHGSVSFQWVPTVIDNGNCKGKSTHTMTVVFTPEKGYRGKDSFTISMRFPLYIESGGPGGTKYEKSTINLTIR